MSSDNQIVIDSFRYDATNDYEHLIKHSTGILQDVFRFLKDWYSPSKNLLVNTSGSTGTPKTINLPKQMLLQSAYATCQQFNLSSESVLHLCLPVKYIAGKMMIVRALACGGNLLVEEPGNAPLKGLTATVSFSAMTPMQVARILEEKPERFAIVEQLIIGGGSVHPTLNERLQNMETHCYSSYGMTETATHVALRRLNGRTRSDLFSAIGETWFSIDERSCLVINAPHLNVRELVTNDVVELADHKAFRWLGRFDNVINTGAIKVFPERMEMKMSRVIKTPFFFIGQEDTVLGEKVVLVVQGARRDIDLSPLDQYERPKAIYFVDAFDYTQTGKIQRKQTFKKALNA